MLAGGRNLFFTSRIDALFERPPNPRSNAFCGAASLSACLQRMDEGRPKLWTQSHDHEFRKGGFRPPNQPVALLKCVSRGHFYAQLNAAPGAYYLGLRGSTPRNNFLYLIPVTRSSA
jgi:hypothetical protein